MIVVTHAAHADSAPFVDILRAAGVPVLGEEPPAGFSELARSLVRPAFYETLQDQGVYFKTNPDPFSQVYLHAEDAVDLATRMKVFGVLRTEQAYLGHVLVGLPHFRAARSLDPELPGTLAWWNDCFLLLRDAATRRYPLRMVSVEALARDPRGTVTRSLEWLGLPASESAVALAEALAPIVPPPEPEETTVPVTVLDVFEELHRRVDQEEGFDQPFLERLYAVNEALTPHILQKQVAALKSQALKLRRKD